MILLVSGPSGVGKTRFVNIATDTGGVHRILAWTTRTPRLQERPEVDYHFVSRGEFHRKIRSGELIDWDYLIGNYYGYGHEINPSSGLSVAIIAPVVARMAIRMRRSIRDSVTLFLDAPDDTLGRNVADRQYSAMERELRDRQDEEERVHAPLFDHVVPDASSLSQAAILTLINRLCNL